jgi:hypothetical protein
MKQYFIKSDRTKIYGITQENDKVEVVTKSINGCYFFRETFTMSGFDWVKKGYVRSSSVFFASQFKPFMS